MSVMQLALEALDSDNPDIQLRAAIALRQALETEPEALRLADALDDEFTQGRISNHNGRKAAAELRRLHEVNQDLLKALHEALETEQEPVAWMFVNEDGECEQIEYGPVFDDPGVTPLYTAPPKQWVGLTDEEIDALSQARSLTDELMDCVDRLGSEADTVDPRVWQHLLVYAPKPEKEPVAWRYALDASVEGPRWIYIDKDPHQWLQGPAMVNAAIEELHTSPQPSKPWVGLTDQEVMVAAYQAGFDIHEDYENEDDPEAMHWWTPDGEAGDDSLLKLRDLIEAKLKERNT